MPFGIHDWTPSLNSVAKVHTKWYFHPLTRVVKTFNVYNGVCAIAGNAILPLNPTSLDPELFLPEKQRFVAEQLPQVHFESRTETWDHYCARFATLGVIVEAFIEGKIKRSPSVQGQITPQAQVEILSTHDQILGGPSQQIYLGCHFPADAAYRQALQTYGIKVGTYLMELGVLERFSVDFIAVQRDQAPHEWDLNAIEINLRKGGTTPPFMTLKLLTNGRYFTAEDCSARRLTPIQYISDTPHCLGSLNLA